MENDRISRLLAVLDKLSAEGDTDTPHIMRIATGLWLLVKRSDECPLCGAERPRSTT